MEPMTERPEALVWYAVRCRGGAERKAADGLREMGFDVYTPMETRFRRDPKTRQAVNVEHPLIPSYLFVGVKTWGPRIYEVQSVEPVHDVVRYASREAAPIRPRFVDELRARQAAGEFDFTPKRKTIKEGGQALILTGSFQGHIGKVLSVPPEGRAQIMLSGIFAGTVTIDVKNLEPVEEEKAA